MRGYGGSPSSSTVEIWDTFIARPTAGNWYRAHNASIVAAYLDHRDLAECESRTERFFLNVVLTRVLPDRYPADDGPGSLLHAEHGFGRMLDYAVIQPRLQRLYAWSGERARPPRAGRPGR